MEHKSEGICRLCLKTFSGSAIGRHLESCKKKAEQDAQEAAKRATTYKIYHIRISSGKYYWLNIEMPSSASLEQLDDFLRGIWVECCSHLSSFSINGVEYQDTRGMDDFDVFWGPRPQSLNKKLNAFLKTKDTFKYEYDFGSTTYLDGKIVGERRGWLNGRVRILARNNPYRFDCETCGKEASDICIECDSFVCEACIENHACGEEMALPVVNSPRMGVCGFTGGYLEDDFEPSLMDK